VTQQQHRELDAAGIGRFFADHYRSAGDTLFRLETLPGYDVTDDGPNWRLWQEGAAEPDPAWKEPWLDTLRREHRAGLRASRVRIFGKHLTDYERFECHFGYALNGPAGEEIGVLRAGEHAIPGDLIVQDFWLVNDAHVIVMRYDEAGRFLRGDLLDDDAAPRYVATRRAAQLAAEPFDTWWARHPELHRRSAAA